MKKWFLKHVKKINLIVENVNKAFIINQLL